MSLEARGELDMGNEASIDRRYGYQFRHEPWSMDLDSHTLENVYHVLLIHVPANQPFLPPSFALILSPISYTDNTF